MKTKTMSALLRAVLLAAGLLLVVFFFLFLPFYGQDTVRYAPEFAWAYWPCLIWAWAFAVPIFWAMVPAWRVCGSIAVKGMAFTGKNARDLRTVSRLAFADAVIFPAGMLIVAYLGAGSAPLTLLITPLVTFFCLAAGIVLYVLSRQEDPAHPLSDQALCALLEQEGIHLARRTVAKYRMEQGVGSSAVRRV